MAITTDTPPKPVTRKQLSAAAALVAEKLNLQLKSPQPMNLMEDAPVTGYIRLVWVLETPDGQPWGSLSLRCEGGYGGYGQRGKKDSSWFKSWVDVSSEGGYTVLGATLVEQWDYPNDPRASAKHTRIRFVEWANALKHNPMAPEEKRAPRPK